MLPLRTSSRSCDADPAGGQYGLALTEAAAYPVERRRGWRETPDAPARSATDVWDEERADELRMTRPQPEPAGERPAE